MKKRYSLLLALSCVCICVLSAEASVVNYSGDEPGFNSAVAGLSKTEYSFDELDPNEVIFDQYETQVRFLTKEGHNIIARPTAWGTGAHSEPLCAEVPKDYPEQAFFELEFSQPVRGASLWVLDLKSNGADVEVFNESNGLLASYTIGSGGLYTYVALFSNISEISRIRITTIWYGDGIGFDDIVVVPVCKAEPIAYWSFDDPCNPGRDDSGNGNDGTVNGAVSTDGICGNALSFDGQNDYVDIANAAGLNPTDAITITAWFKADTFPPAGTYAWPSLVSKYIDGVGGYDLSVQKIYEGTPQITTGIFLEDLGPGGHITIQESLPTEVVLPNIWYFTAMTYDGSEFTLYRAKEGDAAPSTNASASGSGGLATSDSHLNIGECPYNPGRYWDGLIDEVRIYDRALSESEIAELAEECEPEPEPEIAVSPLTYDFGDVEIGSSTTTFVTVSNTGEGDLTIDGIDFQPGGSSYFSVTSAPPLPAIVSAGGTIDVEVTFSPLEVYYSSAVLEIISNDPDEPVVEVIVGGVGVWIEPPPDEQIAEIIDFIDESAGDGTLEGDGPGNSADKRLNALINMIESAGNLIDDELYEQAYEQLLSLYKKCDGLPKPPDFVIGDASAELAEQIQNMMGSLSFGGIDGVYFENDMEGITSIWTLGEFGFEPADVIKFAGNAADELRLLEEEGHWITLALFAGLQVDGTISAFLTSEGNIDEFFYNIAEDKAPEIILQEAGLAGEILSLASSLFQLFQSYNVASVIANSTGDIYIILPEYPKYELPTESGECYSKGIVFAADDLSEETLGDIGLFELVYYESLDEKAINPNGYSLGKANWDPFQEEYVPVLNNYEWGLTLLGWRWVSPQ